MSRIATFIFLIQFLLPQERVFRHYTVEDGLSQNSVYGITQDTAGFMWFSTADGVNKFDGYTFTIFHPNPNDSLSLLKSFARSIVPCKDGTLWFGLNNSLSQYHPLTNNFTSISAINRFPEPQKDDNVYGIVSAKNGTVWVALISGVYSSADSGKKFTLHYGISSDNNIFSLPRTYTIFEDHNGRQWIGTENGLYIFDTAKNYFVPFAEKDFFGKTIRSFAESDDGTLWVGTQFDGLYSISPTRKKVRHFDHTIFKCEKKEVSVINAIVFDKTGTLWLSTYEYGLFSLNPATNETKHFRNNTFNSKSLGFDVIRKLFIDANDNLWIGTDGGGISVTQLFPKPFELIKNDPNNKSSLSDNFVKAIYQDSEGIVWIGSGNGLNRYDLRTKNTEVYPHHINTTKALGNQIYSIIEDRVGMLWISTQFGISSFDKKRNRFVNYDIPQDIFHATATQVNSIAIAPDGMFWLTTDGMLLFDPRNKTYSRPNYFSDTLRKGVCTSILCDSRNIFWVGSFANGLHRYNQTTNEWKHFNPMAKDTNSISSAGIRGIFEEAPGILWIGTENGLNNYNESENRFIKYFEKDGLPNSFVYGILPDTKGNLWISTNRGLSKFNPKEKTFRNYTIEDGLQASEFNTGAFFRNPATGMMFFGGIGGVTYFYPDSIKDSEYSPNIVLTDFKKFDQSVVTTQAIYLLKEIVLPFDENTFTFSFAGLDFTNSKNIRYKYKLESLEREWIDAGTRRDARYTNLADGDYTFRVRATNADAILGKNELTIHVIIIPPVWKRWWFILLTIIIIIGNVFLVIRYYFTRKVRKQMKQYELEKEKLEERMRIRDKIARDLHDDLASTVGSAGLFIETAKRTLGKNFEQTKEYLDKTSSILNEAEEAMSDIVWSVSPKHDTLQGLAARIRLVTTDLCRAHGIVSLIHVNGSLEKSLTDDIRRGFYLVFKEVLNNSLKHSKATSITIWVGEENNRLTLRVKDNGIGFSLTEQKEKLGGNGMNNILIRAEEIGAEIQITSLIGEGTTILLEKQMTHLSH